AGPVPIAGGAVLPRRPVHRGRGPAARGATGHGPVPLGDRPAAAGRPADPAGDRGPDRGAVRRRLVGRRGGLDRRGGGVRVGGGPVRDRGGGAIRRTRSTGRGGASHG